jgi:hypothetical protein
MKSFLKLHWLIGAPARESTPEPAPLRPTGQETFHGFWGRRRSYQAGYEFIESN